MPRLVASPLTREAFAPFGDVIEIQTAGDHFPINGGTTERFDDLGTAVALGEGARTAISMVRAQPFEFPHLLHFVERHPDGSQAFIPMSGRPYLVVVAPAGQAPAARDLRVFLARADQGVNYVTGVWHHPLLALEGVSDFLVVDRAGPGHNCDEIDLDTPLVIDASLHNY